MLLNSAYISLFIQFITGVIDIFGLNIPIPQDVNLFRDLLKIELSVQTIEFIFYIWMIYNFKNIKNITPYRYFDWLITTPVMLLTLMAYLDTNKLTNIIDFIKNNK